MVSEVAILKLLQLSATDLVLAPRGAQKSILDVFSKAKQFPPFRLKSPQFLYPDLDDDYLAIMLERHKIQPAIAKQMVPAFDYVDEKNCKKSSRLEEIYEIKRDLCEKAELRLFHKTRLPFEKIIWIDTLPGSTKADSFPGESIYLYPEVSTSVTWAKCLDKEAELDFVYQSVLSLLSQGIALEAIHILNMSPSDNYQVAKRFKASGIPVNRYRKLKLDKYPLTIDFISCLNSSGVESALDSLISTTVETSSLEERLLFTITAVIDKYPKAVLLKHPELLIYELRTNFLQDEVFAHAIHLEDIDYFEPVPANYYLVMNATEDWLPVKMKDEDYLSDWEKQAIGMDTSARETLRQKSILEAKLRRLENLTFSYAVIVDEFPRTIASLSLGRPSRDIDGSLDFPIIYASNNLGILNCAKMEYQYSTYGIQNDPYFPSYRQLSPLIRHYDPRFKGLEAKTMSLLSDRKTYLSATSLKLFFECPFHYLLDSILKINPKETTLSIFFGNLTHQIMEALYQPTFQDYEPIISRFEPEFPAHLEHKRPLFLNVFSKRIRDLLARLCSFREEAGLDEFAHEWNVQYDLDPEGRFVVTGKIDRILTYISNVITKAIVIDYKTGNQEFKMRDFENGSDIQLPFYLHLLHQSPQTCAFEPMGFFYQKIRLGRYTKVKAGDPIRQSLALDGNMVPDPYLLDHLVAGDWVKGIRLKQSGEVAASVRVLSKAAMAEVESKMGSMIRDAAFRISEALFDIRPLPIMKNETLSKSCEYCHGASICYHRSFASPFATTEEVNVDDED